MRRRTSASRPMEIDVTLVAVVPRRGTMRADTARLLAMPIHRPGMMIVPQTQTFMPHAMFLQPMSKSAFPQTKAFGGIAPVARGYYPTVMAVGPGWAYQSFVDVPSGYFMK